MHPVQLPSDFPKLAKEAHNQGFEEVADWFETLAKAEKSHMKRFQIRLNKLK